MKMPGMAETVTTMPGIIFVFCPLNIQQRGHLGRIQGPFVSVALVG